MTTETINNNKSTTPKYYTYWENIDKLFYEQLSSTYFDTMYLLRNVAAQLFIVWFKRISL